jgi:hypothetical protein
VEIKKFFACLRKERTFGAGKVVTALTATITGEVRFPR